MNFFDTTKDLLQEKVSGYGKTYLEHKDEAMKQKVENKKAKEARLLEKFSQEIDALPLDKKQELFNKLKDEIWFKTVDSAELHYDCRERIQKPRNREMDAGTKQAYLWLHVLAGFIPMSIIAETFSQNDMASIVTTISGCFAGLGLGVSNNVCYEQKPLTNAINDGKTKRNFSKLESLINEANLSTKKMEIVSKSIVDELSSDPEVDAMAVNFTNRLAIAEAKKTVDDLSTARTSLINYFRSRKNESKDEMER